MDCLGVSLGLCITTAHLERDRSHLRTHLEPRMIENILLMAALMALGVSVTAALLCGFVYYLEIQGE